jgi:hypothetical protein
MAVAGIREGKPNNCRYNHKCRLHVSCDSPANRSGLFVVAFFENARLFQECLAFKRCFQRILGFFKDLFLFEDIFRDIIEAFFN